MAAPAPVREAGTDLGERVARLERMLEARNQSQLQMQQQLDAVESDVNALRGDVEVYGHKLEQILARQRDLYQELERRMSQASATPPATPTATSSTAAESTIANEGESALYQRAVRLVLKERKYDAAARAFAEFIQKYPQSSYASNAHYWNGQLKFTKGQFDDAEKSFLIVANEFKNSVKRGDALLKLGMIAAKKNNQAKATNLYKQVIKEYPSSSAAQLAKTKLK